MRPRAVNRALGAMVVAAVLGAQPSAPRCATMHQGAMRTPAPLECVELVPVPGLEGASGTLTLEPEQSPFGVAVDAFGHQRVRLVATIAGLPAPRTMGGATAFIAWIASVTMDSAVSLGLVRNGRTDLGVTTRDQFRVLVSAENDPRARSRSGPLVLRAVSPSARLLAHRDVRSIPVVPGGAVATAGARPADAVHDHATEGASAEVWPMPAMPATMPMMPAVRGLVPDVAPFAPGGALSTRDLPNAGARATVRLADHDTLRLTATLVRRVLDGRWFTGYAFNGQIPGPLLRVRQGSEVVVLFRNDTDLPGSIHWHGVRLANTADGAPGMTQPPVEPGGTFTYRVRFPDAGTFWYHGHVRDDIQLALGLAGNIVVEPRTSGARAAPAAEGESADDDVLLLGDVLEGSRGPLPFGAEAATHALSGRVGNRALVNGAPTFSRALPGGSTLRVHLTNGSAARLFNISWPGARAVVVASDLGPFEREELVESVAIGPGERYIVDVRFPDRGIVPMLNHVRALDHMLGTMYEGVDTLGAYELSTSTAHAARPAPRANASVTAEIERLARGLTPAPDLTLAIVLHPGASLPAPVLAMLMGPALSAEWNDGMPMENWLTTARDVTWALRDVRTGDENEGVHWRVRAGERKILRIVNDADAAHSMAHPIHLHGQRFVVLRRNGRAVANRAWKDTALVPAGETVDLLVDFTNPGEWMLHCHIAEHLGAGMMVHVTVDPAPHAGQR